MCHRPSLSESESVTGPPAGDPLTMVKRDFQLLFDHGQAGFAPASVRPRPGQVASDRRLASVSNSSDLYYR